MNESRRPARVHPLAKFAAILALSLLAGGVIGGVSAIVGDGGTGQIIVAVVSAVTMAGVLVVCLRWWAGLDEAAREAHKWAWWWGGSTGMLVGLIVLVALLSYGGAEALPTAVTAQAPEDLIYLGAMGMLLLQMIGYGVAWAAWWLRRR